MLPIWPKARTPDWLRKISDLKIKCLEREIAAHEEFLSTHNARDEVYAKKSEQLRPPKSAVQKSSSTMHKSAWHGIRPIYSFDSSWVKTFLMPGVFARLCRSCNVHGKIRMRA